MALNSINTNIAAYYAQRNIGSASSAASSSISRLSSGDRIVRAADDVAALSVGTSLRTQVTTLRQALSNTSIGSSLLQVADGALSQVSDILQRQKAIAVQAGSGSLSASERSFLNQEFQSLTQEIDRISGNTNFNGVKLLNGSLTSSGSFLTTDTGATFAAAGISTGNAAINTFANNNQAVIGNLSNITATNLLGTTDGSAVQINVEINGVVFRGVADFSSMTNAGNTDVTVNLTQVTENGATPMTMNMVVESDTAWSTAGALQTQLRNQFGSAYITQARNLTGYGAANVANTVLSGVSSAAPVFTTWTMDAANTDAFGNVESVSVTRVGDATDSNGNITMRVNGAEYSLANLAGITDSSDGILDAGDVILLTRTFPGSSRTETISYTLTGLTTSINLNTAQGAKALEDALKQVFGVGAVGGSGGLSFQVGNTADDSLRVAFDGVSTDKLFNNVALDVLTANSAAVATNAIDAAIKTVTGVRATVGALQSRFDFAAANIESTIQNQDAARGQLLDTDIASEATAYAQAQVQLQAGIAVLAQANQLPQNLLKLIG